ncbi:MAG TPA: CoA transferase, partial [Thermoplasmata archaeon]|nr:CoA transferase [Thermoplasmata archaeon]
KAFLGIHHAEWDDPAVRRAHRTEIDGIIRARCEGLDAADLEDRARAADVAISRVYDIAALAKDPHVLAREMLVDWEDPVAGKVRGAGIAPKFGATPGRIWRGAPWLGQDNDAVLGTILGYDASTIAGLRAAGVLGEFRPPVGPSPAPDARAGTGR